MIVSAGFTPVTNEPALRRSCRLGAASLAAAFASIFLFSTSASAESFVFGDMNVSVDTTISAGITMRASERDCTKVSLVNGGCYNGDGRNTSINSDNGNLNYDQWDFVNQTLKATVDIQGTWENYGFFVRPTAFYDFVYAENDLEFRNLSPNAKDQLDYDVDVLDAFVYGNWDIDGHYTTVRFGKQVLNWGESLFIQGGINAFQAIDVTRIRTPGAELKDALTPMPMLFASTTITPNLSIEAFWQFAYEYTELDPAGSFFSTDDIVGRGSLPGLLNAMVDNPDLAFPPGTFPPNPLVPIAVQRSSDRIESETDQFGVALRYYAEELGNGVDFGFYGVRYTSRLPYLGFTTGPDDLDSACAQITGTGAVPGVCGTAPTDPFNQAAFAYAAGQLKYFYSFPTIETLGASFATTVSGTAVSGELSFSPDMPFGVSDLEQNASQLDGTGASGPLTGSPGPVSQLPAAGPNQDTVHMIELDALQGQIGTVKLWGTSDPIPAFLRADTTTFVFNAGFVYVPDAGDYPLNRVGPEGGIRNPFGAAVLSPTFNNPQYATSFSSGYRMVFAPTYNNAFGTAFTLTPNISWRHDVSGYSPGPNTANYLKGMKQISIGIDADYQSTYRASLSYTNIFGAGMDNPTFDRDFIMASVSYSF
ncbi:DUF1302 domain-containing protein [Parvibaculum sp.]|jgi:hypothetical protein|uniref:DUF1302 domain-containing protein n=4 Tax=Parvibaculum sp. TaxID=2024848 RepID=UPI0025F83EB0|nr:DUF1302 domain-containing protein [Parvibaculum sp.]